MDYYKVLGLSRSASKKEIKDAFRNLAVQFHPDKHSGSPKSVRDGATHRFKQASEAYEILIDDRKRADYNLRCNHHRGTSGSDSYGYGHHNRPNSSSYNGYGYTKAANGEGFVSRFEIALRFLTTRAFILNVCFAGALLGGTVIIDLSRDTLWKMHNSGKSFEEAMDSIEKTKVVKEKA